MADQLSILYTGLKTALSAISGVKHVNLWNNQFEHEKENVPFGFPCIFIEFIPIEFRDLLNGVQQYDMEVHIHIGFESYKTTDIDILRIKQEVYKIANRFQAGPTSFFSYLGRINEIQNFDHDNVQEYIQVYAATGKDFDTDDRADKVDATLTDDITKDIEIPTNLP